MSKKGQKNLRGEPEIWDELKQRYSMTLTPTAVKGLDALAKSMNLSRSELIERIGRGIIPLHPDALLDDGEVGRQGFLDQLDPP